MALSSLASLDFGCFSMNGWSHDVTYCTEDRNWQVYFPMTLQQREQFWVTTPVASALDQRRGFNVLCP